MPFRSRKVDGTVFHGKAQFLERVPQDQATILTTPSHGVGGKYGRAIAKEPAIDLPTFPAFYSILFHVEAKSFPFF